MVSMATPSSFQYEKKTYSLSAADKRLFKETYLKIFNASMSPGITAEEVIKLRDVAYMEAKLAVLDKKLS